MLPPVTSMCTQSQEVGTVFLTQSPLLCLMATQGRQPGCPQQLWAGHPAGGRADRPRNCLPLRIALGRGGVLATVALKALAVA